MGVTFIAPQGTYTAPAKLVSKSITENGTYDPADDNANGYSSVTVNVEGGGGSSDFSTAEVTITSLNGNTVLIPYVATANNVSYLHSVVSDPGAYNVALYNGKAMGEIFDPQGTVATTGDITYADGIFLISGNGTIAISAAL